jgi:hypothetical protein
MLLRRGRWRLYAHTYGSILDGRSLMKNTRAAL